MGTKYYCAECTLGEPGVFKAPDKLIINVPEYDKYNEMMGETN